MSRRGPGYDVTHGHGRGTFRRNLQHLEMQVVDGAAQNQSIARNKFVVILLGSLSSLCSAGRIAKKAKVNVAPIEVVKAKYQSSHAIKAEGQEAAHPVPGYVVVGRTGLEDLAPNVAASNMLKDLFGYCNHAPRIVNQTDSLTERGTRPALAEACEFLVSETKPGTPFHIDSVALERAYRRIWCVRAAEVYRTVLRKLEEEFPRITTSVVRDADGNIDLPQSSPTEAEQRASVQRDILKIYLRGLADIPNRLQQPHLAQLEMLFRDGTRYDI